MPFGLPLTLWRFTLVELTRHFLISGAVLVTVLSFAMAVQQVTAGTLGPGDALRFMMLAAVPMTAYALPFACGFAATMVFHRMGADNELIAAHAGGLGRGRLLVPVAAFGLLVSLALGGMNDQVIPRFWRSMESIVTEDVSRLMRLKLAAGETIEVGGGLMVHADAVVEPDLPDGSEARGVLKLIRPAFAEVADDGSIAQDATASEAWVWFYGDEAGTRVVIQASDASGATGGGWGELKNVTRSMVVDGGLEDDPKFMTLARMGYVADHPDETNMTEYNRRYLSMWLAHRRVLEWAAGRIESGEPLELTDVYGRTLSVRATTTTPTATGDGLVLGGSTERPVVVRRVRDGEPETVNASEVVFELEWDGTTTTRTPSYSLELRQPRADEEGRTIARPNRVFGGVEAPLAVTDVVAEATSAELLELAEAEGKHPRVTHYAGQLQRRLDYLMREILSKVHERFAMTFMSIVMALSGAVTAIVFRDRLPLQAYLATFFPSLGAMLLVSLGQQLTYENGASGLPLLWGGAIAQAVGTGVVLFLIRRR